MAAITKEVKIDKRIFLAREITVEQIRQVTSSRHETAVDAIIELLGFCSDATAAELLPLAPSEIRQLTDAVVEVNKDFFEQAALVNMKEAAGQLEKLMKSFFLIPFLDSSERDTE